MTPSLRLLARLLTAGSVSLSACSGSGDDNPTGRNSPALIQGTAPLCAKHRKRLRGAAFGPVVGIAASGHDPDLPVPAGLKVDVPKDVVVRLDDVSKSFGEQDVLKHISFDARRAETTVIIGGSGAGKTTLIRIIVALEKPTSGRVIIDGEDIVPMRDSALNAVRRKFGMVYQYAALLDSQTVMENVAFPLVEHTKLSGKEIRERVLAKLEVVGLDPLVVETKFPAELSGGMRKRVGLARALMLEPKVLVYDEPTSGLDPEMSRLVDDLIEETRDRFGVTSLVISHDIASCFRIAHQAILVIKGEVVARGKPEELAHGDNEVAKHFIRESWVDVDAVSSRR